MRKFILLFALIFSTLFGAKAQQLEVNGDGATTTSGRIPVYGLYMDVQQKCQIIYPASKLTELVGKQITKITFFATSVPDYMAVNAAWQNDLHIRMASTTQENLADAWFSGPTTEVYVGKLSLTEELHLIIELDTPFEYTGNNLFVEFDLPNIEFTTYKSASFHGTTESYAVSRQAQGASGYTGAGTPYYTLPKILIDYTESGAIFNPATSVTAIANGTNVDITWNAPAKSRQIFFSDNFESGNLNNWTQIDADADLNMWEIRNYDGLGGSKSAASWSWAMSGALTPDNYLVTPLIEGATTINYWIGSGSSVGYSEEHYAVMVSSTGTNVGDFTLIFEETLPATKGNALQANESRSNVKAGPFYERTIELPAGTKYVAFRHYNCTDLLFLNLDNVTVYSGSPGPDYTYTITREGTDIATGVTATNYTDTNVAAGTYEYCVKVAYEAGTSAPACAPAVTIEEVICNPATNVAATANGSNINVTWSAPAKRGDVLLNETFSAATVPSDWTQIDVDGDGYIWEIIPGTVGHGGSGRCISSKSWEGVNLNPNNYLITPLVEGATSVNYWVSVESTYYTNEHYAVMASSTGTNVDDFTLVFEETMTAKGNISESDKSRDNSKQGTWYERNIDLPAGTKYIAFRHYNCTGQLYLNLDDVTVYGNAPAPDYTYTITRNGVEIATGVTETAYTDKNVANGTYNYCVKVVYANCTSEPACAPAVTIDVPTELIPVYNLSANVAGDKVTLNWSKPTQGGNNATVILEAHDVWGDGTGYQMLLDADAVEYGQTIPTGNPLTNDCNAPANLYDVFEYKIPENADPVCTTQNIVWNGEASITIPAGVYDYCIVNPVPNDRLWIAGGENGRKNDYLFEAGKTYRFLAEISGYSDMVTIIITDSNSGKVIDIVKSEYPNNNDNLRKSTVYHDFTSTDYTAKTTRALTGYDIYRNGVKISQISNVNQLTYTDNNVVAGTHNYCVVAVYNEGDSPEVCIDVTVEEADCSPATNVEAVAEWPNVNITWTAPNAKSAKTVIVFEDFESYESGLVSGKWNTVDANNDGISWILYDGDFEAHSGTKVVASYSWNSYPIEPNEYLISPNVEGATKVTFYYSVNQYYPLEHYAVMASSTGNNLEDFTTVFEETANGYSKNGGIRASTKELNNADKNMSPWIERTVDLPEGTKYIAFRHYNCIDQNIILLDDITVFGEAVADYTYKVTRNGTEVASGLTNTTYTDSNVADGSYEYCVEVVYPTCTSEPACTAQPVIVGIDNDEFASVMTAYPNPAKDVIHIKGDVAKIAMYNSFGQAVRADINNGQIDVTSLQNGIYYLVITGLNDVRKVEKIVISK